MTMPGGEGQTDEQRDWLLHSAALWREAHSIAAANPGVDVGDVLVRIARCRSIARGGALPMLEAALSARNARQQE
jgi:hypothetical protein